MKLYSQGNMGSLLLAASKKYATKSILDNSVVNMIWGTVGLLVPEAGIIDFGTKLLFPILGKGKRTSLPVSNK